MTHKSFLQECPTRVSHKSVPEECPTRVSYKSVILGIWNVLAFGFVGSILFLVKPRLKSRHGDTPKHTQDQQDNRAASPVK